MVRIRIEPKEAQNVRSLIKTAVENELKILKAGISRTYRKLGELEKIYRITSEEFYDKFRKGEILFEYTEYSSVLSVVSYFFPLFS